MDSDIVLIFVVLILLLIFGSIIGKEAEKEYIGAKGVSD